MYGPLGYLCVTFVIHRDPKTSEAIQKKIFMFLCDCRSKTKEIDNSPVQVGVKFVTK
jgi:hypothetical protein